MSDYILMKTDAGEIFDPWLNQHLGSGGKIINICHESIQVKASLSKWTEGGIGIYNEPNIWVRYRI